MLILYVAMKYDYGRPEQGLSFEHCNFYDSLLNLGHDILYFDFMTLLQTSGRASMNRRLLDIAKAERPTLLFTVLFTDEIVPAVVREISESTPTTTLNWFCDDHWRFDHYSRYWAPCFNWVVTTAASVLPKYTHIGYSNVIKNQWACNHFLYRKLDLPLEYDVTFIGQPHGNRRQVIHAVRDAGIKVKVWGSSWDTGRLSQDEMIRVFNQTRINLNLSNASVMMPSWSSGLTAIARRYLIRSVNLLPFGTRLKAIGKQCLAMTRTLGQCEKRAPRLTAGGTRYVDQIKGRNFEVPGCGGFLLTEQADDLESYYHINEEIVCFNDIDDLIGKIRYYLRNEEERKAIAEAGYQRTIQEHTYVHRFSEIFARIGLPSSSVASVFEGKVRPGLVEMVS